jgi:dihydroorotate dehydrogenase
MGFNNCGLADFRRHIQAYRPFIAGVPLFANIGKNKATPNEQAIADYRQGVEYLSHCVDGFVINLSSPNTPGLVQLQTEKFLEALSAILVPDLPVFLKLSPDLEDAAIGSLCDYVARSSRFSGLVLTNTSRELADRLHGAPEGGLSGVSLSERALACVVLARQRLPETKVLIGTGGVVDAAAVKRMREAGADLVELYTGLVYRGPRLVREAAAILAEE